MSASVRPASVCPAPVRPCDAVTAGPECGPERLRWLVRRIAGHDRGAFAELFDRCSGPVLRTLHRQAPDRHQIAGLLAGTFVEVWWLAGSHAGPDSDIPAWIERIVRRRVADSRPSESSADPHIYGGDRPEAPWAQSLEVELARLLTTRA